MRTTSSGHLVNRYIGLSLGGAKSDRTCLTVVDYYRQQSKAFVIDTFTSIGVENGLTADQVLLKLVEDLQPGITLMAVDAPLTLPPCISGCDPKCGGYEKCKKPEVRWMRKSFLRACQEHRRLKHCTPYSQRPVDVYFRYKHLGTDLFQDETMGANLAPQAVRMSYLKRFFSSIKLVEVWPKLTLYYVHKSLKLTKSEVMSYRNLQRGADARVHILESLAKHTNLFIYDGDYKKFVADMSSFDSLLCAWVAMMVDLGHHVKFRSDLPLESGWVEIPEL